jgi:uncharacterized LabA/DUF88 family protein
LLVNFLKEAIEMASLAILVDGGYVHKLAKRDFSRRIHLEHLANLFLETRKTIESKVLRSFGSVVAFYYDCPPYMSNPPTEDEIQRLNKKERFFDRLRHELGVEVKEGYLRLVGYGTTGEPIFEQKGVDMRLGLDLAQMSWSGQISHAAIVAGDGDFYPAVEAAKTNGTAVWLFHGPKPSARLRMVVDEEREIHPAYLFGTTSREGACTAA